MSRHRRARTTPRPETRARLLGLLRRAVSAVWRRLPGPLRAHWRRLAGVNTALLRWGAWPLATVRMQAGHRVLVDLRSGTEWAAFYTGEFDDHRVGVAAALLSTPGATAVDAGANIGFWSVPLAGHAAAMGRRVVAFEPVPVNAARLRTNLAHNGLARTADVHEVALSDRVGTARITLREDFLTGAETGNAALEIHDGTDVDFVTLPVEVTTLDLALQPYPNADVRVVKADLEGHEDRFLHGATATLRRCRPVAFLEWNRIYYQRRGIDPTRAVTPLLRELDYRCLVRDPDQLWKPQQHFHSPRPVDDLIITPAEQADTLLSMLHANHR